MAYAFLKRGKWWVRLMGSKVPGKWSSHPTDEPDHDSALRYAKEAQKRIDRRNATKLTLREYLKTWLVKREAEAHDWKKDRGRLDRHVLPVLGDKPLTDITSGDIADLVHRLRFTTKLANRTVRNVYSVLAAVMRDAAIGNKIPVSPCILTEAQLGPVVDKDPEWRTGAVFAREEAVTLISDERIPFDRRIVYGFGLLAGLRPGEAAALRWRNYDAAKQPLGCLTIAVAYSTTNHKIKGTKTEAVRAVPVHPTLAAMLEEWRAGWAVMFGREPGPDDLIVPLPPDVKLRSRKGERFRGSNYSLRRWTELDLPMLGWRHRSVYDTKSTFITLAIEDGANKAIIRERVTHTKPRRDAFDGYDRGPHWIETCREVAKLRIERAVTTRDQGGQGPDNTPTIGSGGGFRKHTDGAARPQNGDGTIENRGHVRTSCDLSLELLVTSSCDHTQLRERRTA